jgi:class 3 adenylate cyclase
MFDIWASGVMARIWQNGGCCDKFVGDCCIAHFGPPFYEEDTKEYCRRAIECAKDIRRWTKEFLQRDEECFKVIRDSDQLEKFGVATGINLGKVNVGIIGPNQDFTAFGAEMNNASRIQAKAGCDEILMMKSVHSQVSDLFDFEGPFTTELKNVKNKVEYYRLKD